MLGNVAVSWRAKKQSLTSKSSAEAEYIALANVSCEAMWLRNLLTDLPYNFVTHVSLLCDNKAPIDLTANPVYHARTKHIEIDCHFIREKIAAGIMTVTQVASKHNTTNILTKGLGKYSHWSCCYKTGIVFCVNLAVKDVSDNKDALEEKAVYLINQQLLIVYAYMTCQFQGGLMRYLD